MNKKIVLFLCMAFLLLFCGCSQKKNEQTLLVGTNTEFPPFSFREKGEIVGFDIDVVKEVVKRMQREIVFKDMPFDALIAELNLGHVDLIAAGMTATPERAKRVSFSKEYFQGDPLVIVVLDYKKNKQTLTLEDFLGKRIVVNEGFTADVFMTSKVGYDIIRLPTVADGFMAVKSGRADAFITAASTVKSFTDTQDASQFQLFPIDGTNENTALVVAKDNLELLKKVQAALDSMEADGTLLKFKEKWKLS
ncbi:MAG: ABC transporter substrate-binding protein [Chlamydiales bacterium]|nr:ABC transporter substrate-binding protein [Chlamydiales bacterium]